MRNCEYCNKELHSWVEETPDEFGTQRWEESDPCPLGCDSHDEMNLEETEGYYAFRVHVAKTLMDNAQEDIKITRTLESLDNYIQEWWSEYGREAFEKENR